MAVCMCACLCAHGCVYVCLYVGYICAYFFYLDNEGLCCVISLRHFSYYEAELLIERSYLSQSLWKIIMIDNF